MLSFDPADARQIAREASQLALRLRGQFTAELKPDNTLVTEADRQIEEFLREKLGQLAPGFAFLGEETGLTGDPDAPCWVIDPIDGTTNFVRGLPLWCVSIGAVHQGRPIFGAVAVPPQDELYWAATGHGAWCDKGGQTVRLQALDSGELMQEDLIACNTTVDRVVDFNRVPCRLRNLGSLAYHLTALARGSLRASVAHWHKLYDIAGGMCLCEEAGYVARYLNGQEWLAEVNAPREVVPLVVASPQTMEILLEKLVVL